MKKSIIRLLELAFYIICYAPGPAILLGLLAIIQFGYSKRQGITITLITFTILSGIVVVVWKWRQGKKW
jgi:hypothetical protein